MRAQPYKGTAQNYEEKMNVANNQERICSSLDVLLDVLSILSLPTQSYQVIRCATISL